jgi:hypothetical protein
MLERDELADKRASTDNFRSNCNSHSHHNSRKLEIAHVALPLLLKHDDNG